MSPLLVEYIRRRNSLNISTARNARELLSVCIHEAGHWTVFAHYRVPVTYAIVDRGSRSGGGIVQPPDLTCLVPEEMKAEVECVAALAGTIAERALIPFMDMENIRFGSQRDKQDAQQLLYRLHGSNRDARKSFMEKCVLITDQIIRQNWSSVEALAFELMKHGRICYSKCGVVERRYGIGRDAPATPTRSKSAQQNLAAFHSSPDALLAALLIIS